MMKRKNRIGKFFSSETGDVAIIAAFALVAFLAIASVVTDLGLRYYQKSSLQNALDSAALASVKCLPNKEKAKEVALEYVKKNGFDPDDAVVEFPEEGVVRVSETIVCNTLFAGIFSEKNMVIPAHAAAKFIDKNMSIDFDYLMFYGEDSTFRLNGDFREVAGSIFGNGDVIVNCNDAAVIYDIASARRISFANNMGEKPTVSDHVAHQDMPDWDEMIMSICPKAEKEQFIAPHPHITREKQYKYYISGELNINTYGSYAEGNVLSTSSLTTNYTKSLLYIHGDLYVSGDFMPQCPVHVTGNVYVDGNLTTAWDMPLTVDGELHVKGNTKFQSAASVKGLLYSGGDITLTNGNGTEYRFGSVRCLGGFSSSSAWNAKINVNGSMFIYSKLDRGGGNNTIVGNVNVFGNGLTQNDMVCYMNGNLDLKGDVFCNKGIVAFGGNGDCMIHGIVYSGGSIETRSGGDISLNGCMIAEGNININGASHTYNDSGATLSLYSRKGNINLGSQGTALKMWGIVYAPKGDIKISTDGLMIYGSLVANTLTCNIGCGFYIGRNDRTLPFAKTVRVAALVE